MMGEPDSHPPPLPPSMMMIPPPTHPAWSAIPPPLVVDHHHHQHADPNRLAEEYRACCSSYATQRAQTDLDLLAFNKDGHLLLGASHMYGRYWTGAIWYYQDAKDAPDASLSLTGVECEGGVCDGLFLDDHKMVVVQDSGLVEVVEVVPSENPGGESHHFKTVFSKCEHDDAVMSVSAAAGRKKVITSGLDMCIKVWNVDSMVAEKSYFPAHSQMVTSVSASSTEEAIFVSCSPDGLVLMWDTRMGKPAKAIHTSQSNPPSCVSWQPSSDWAVGVGLQSGEALMLDARSERTPSGWVNVLERPIHRLTFAPHCPGIMAVCGDENCIRVVSWSSPEPSIIYENESHPDFVRGLAWSPLNNKLYSCGWQKAVVVHDLSTMDMNGHILTPP